jgi:hypothetical protein
LLPFKVHQFNLSGRHYLLLPKLTSRQMSILAVRLGKTGAAVSLSSSLVAKSKEGSIHVDPIGICWSTSDPADAILPLIPELLASHNERIALGELGSMYFRAGRRQGKTVVRLSTRLEASALWDALRAAGDCGLSPDEHAVVSTILRLTKGRCVMVTNFPFDGAASRICGGKQYYEGPIDSAEAASTLRQVGGSSRRNSYVPRDATLTFDRLFSPSEAELSSLLGSLGEWCYFTPS